MKYAWLVALLAGAALVVFVAKKPDKEAKPPVPQHFDEEEVHPGLVTPPAPPGDETVYTYPAALRKQEETKKDIFLYFHADWCTWCKKLERETLNDNNVRNSINVKYIKCYVDADTSRLLAAQYKVKGLPAYFVVTPAKVGTRIAKAGAGYKTPAEFLEWLGTDTLTD